MMMPIQLISGLCKEIVEPSIYNYIEKTLKIILQSAHRTIRAVQSKKYPAYHSCFGLYDIKTGKQLTADCEIHFLELPKRHLKYNF